MDAKDVVPILAQVALFLIVSSFGLKAHAREVRAAFAQTSLILKGILAVNVVVPAAAILMCSVLPIDPAVRIGIVIMAVSPLAPLIPGKMLKGGLDASAAAGLYVALILAAIILVPLTIGLLSAIYPAEASISVGTMVRVVGLGVLLPISVGLALATWWPSFARRAAPIASAIGMIAILIIVALILYAQGGAVLGLVGDGSVAAIFVTILAGVFAGHWLGRPDPANSNALAVAAGIRHPGIAALIANENFTDRRIMLAVILFLLVSVVVTALYQRWLGHRTLSRAAQAAAA